MINKNYTVILLIIISTLACNSSEPPRVRSVEEILYPYSQNNPFPIDNDASYIFPNIYELDPEFNSQYYYYDNDTEYTLPNRYNDYQDNYPDIEQNYIYPNPFIIYETLNAYNKRIEEEKKRRLFNKPLFN